MYQLNGGAHANRRIANDAFRRLMSTVDTESEQAAEMMFSCNVCWRTLPREELVKPGMDTDSYAGTKPFNELVIDGMAEGILKKLPTFVDKTVTVREGKTVSRELYLIGTPRRP